MIAKPVKAKCEVIRIVRNPANQQVYVTLKTHFDNVRKLTLGSAELTQS